ncbi:DNA primase protein [Rhizobium phage RHph_Y1_11]|nr:DNA primase protein [Rhizobium phage RHph_Y1_11]
MKKSDVMELLDALGATPTKKQARGKWVTSDCPLGPWTHEGGKSSDDVFGVKLEQGDPFCNCFACGFHDSATGMVLKMRELNAATPVGEFDFKKAVTLCAKADDEIELNFDDIDYEEALKKDEVTIFDDWWVNTFPSVFEAPLGMKYLKDRGVDPDVIKYLDLRFDPKQNRVCAPVLNKKQQFVGLHGRAIYEDTEPRYRMYTYKGRNNPQYWLGENWIDVELPLVVVEGYFDVAKVLPIWANVATPLFANPSIEKMKRIAGCSEIITFFDWGTGGDKGRQRFDEQFGKTHIVTHAKPPAGKKDPGACNIGEIASVLAPILPI